MNLKMLVQLKSHGEIHDIDGVSLSVYHVPGN